MNIAYIYRAALLGLTVVICLVSNPQVTLAASKAKVFREGWIERFSGGSIVYNEPVSIQGWAYDNGKSLTIQAVLQNQSTGQQYIKSDTAYLARADVDAVIRSKKRSYKPVATGFKIIFYDLPSAQYRLKSITFNGRNFKVHQGVQPEVAIGMDNNVHVLSPVKGMATTVSRSGYLDISWSDVNVNNSPTQSYTLFLTPVVPSKTCVIGWVYNAKTYRWKVGDFPPNGDSNCTINDITSGAYTVQVVKQFAPGERISDDSGEIYFTN